MALCLSSSSTTAQPRRRIVRALAVAWLLAPVASGVFAAQTARDPLAAAIARWQERIRSTAPIDDEVRDIRVSSAPLVAEAEQALVQGKRWLALSRLERVWTDLEAAEYSSGIPGDLRQQMSELEREWQRLAPELGTNRAPGPRPAFEPLPAAARALAEAALAQMPVYFEASLDYGRNTAPEYGLFYLGAAQAQRDFIALLAGLPRRPQAESALAPREVSGEIAALRDELLAAYRPPLSIDRHAVFIRISALLKEADELTAAESLYGALLRRLDAKARLARLAHPGRSLSQEEAARRGAAFAARLAESPRDTTLQRLFLETALFSAANPDPAAGGGEIAAAIFDDVLPYFPVVLGPAPPSPPVRLAEATVTLVRWPYT